MAILIEPPEKKPELTGSVIIKDTVVFSSYEDYVLSPKNAETLYFISASPDVTEINFLQKLIIATNTGNIDFIVAKAFLGSTKIYDQLDYPTLDLNFAATKSLDPRITFTRSSSGTYFDSNGVLQTATVNTPRFDHNPNTKESLGLLIEEQRTNLLWRSQDFTDPVWTKQSTVSVTSNAETAPDGTLTADRITASSGFGVLQYASVTVGTLISQSIYLKAGTATRIMFRDFNGAGRHIVVNPSTGAIIEKSGTLLGSGSINCGNGWFRIFFSYNADTTAAVGNVRPDSSGAAQTFIIWGAQTEIGVFPTSYIPTTGSAATRVADVATMTGTNFSSWYRQDEGTILAEYRYLVAGITDKCPFSLDNGTSNETIITASATPNIDRILSSSGGVSQANFGHYNFTAGQLIKRVVSIKFNDAATTANGATVSIDNSYIVPTPTQLVIGAAGYFVSSRINGHIRRLAYYPRRLANSELQLLTT